MNNKIFEVAKTSEYPRIRIGCCIVNINKILAVNDRYCKGEITVWKITS